MKSAAEMFKMHHLQNDTNSQVGKKKPLAFNSLEKTVSLTAPQVMNVWKARKDIAVKPNHFSLSSRTLLLRWLVALTRRLVVAALRWV